MRECNLTRSICVLTTSHCIMQNMKPNEQQVRHFSSFKSAPFFYHSRQMEQWRFADGPPTPAPKLQGNLADIKVGFTANLRRHLSFRRLYGDYIKTCLSVEGDRMLAHARSQLILSVTRFFGVHAGMVCFVVISFYFVCKPSMHAYT